MKTAFAGILLAGCASIADVDVTKYEQVCARSCTTSYSPCIAGPIDRLQSGVKLERCREALELCLKTCPPK